jgi:hypothetical protein
MARWLGVIDIISVEVEARGNGSIRFMIEFGLWSSPNYCK